MQNNDLSAALCEPCQGGIKPLEASDIQSYLAVINPAWKHDEQRHCIERAYQFKNFAKTMFFVNALAHLADQQGHHPDVTFGYNYCRVAFTTHEAGGLTRNDFICAKAVDGLSGA